MILLLPLLGTVLLGILLVDVLLTVFQPQGHGGPMHRAQNRALWLVLRAVGTRGRGRARGGILALAGPIIAALSVAAWGVYLILGFALIYMPFVMSFPASGPRAPFAWVEALYYSGYVASTLGLGDVVAPTTALRLITVLEAVSGFALFAVATTYVLAISREVAASSTLALELSTLLNDGTKGPIGTGNRGQDETMRSWVEGTARSLLRVVHAHGQYPVLHYFRPEDPDRALLVQLGGVLRLLDLRDRGPEHSDGLAFRLLGDVVRRYLIEANHRCLPARFDPLSRPLEEVSPARLYARLLHYMCYEPVSPEVGLGTG